MEKINGINIDTNLIPKIEKISPIIQADNNKKPKQENPKELGKGENFDKSV